MLAYHVVCCGAGLCFMNLSDDSPPQKCNHLRIRVKTSVTMWKMVGIWLCSACFKDTELKRALKTLSYTHCH